MRNLLRAVFGCLGALLLLSAGSSQVLAGDNLSGADSKPQKHGVKKPSRKADDAKDGGSWTTTGTAAPDSSGMSPEQIIDMYTNGAGTPAVNGDVPAASPSASRSPDSGSAPFPIPAVTGTAAPSPDQSSMSSDNDQSASSPAPASGDGDTVITENSIPPNTLRAGELNNQAVDALSAHDYDKAIVCLRQALVLDPNYMQGKKNLRVAYFNQAVDLYNSQKYADAIPILEKAMALNKQIGSDMPEIKGMLDDCRDAVKGK